MRVIGFYLREGQWCDSGESALVTHPVMEDVAYETVLVRQPLESHHNR